MRNSLIVLATALAGMFGITSAEAVVVTYTDTPNLAIGDNNCTDATNGTGLGGISRTITIPAGDAGSILDVNVRVNVTHTWRSDLQMALTDGTNTVILANNHDGSGDNYRALFDTAAPALCSVNSATTCGATNTTGACATTEATCQPNQSLNPYNGLESANRVFTLRICDRAAADTGTLNSWELIVDRNAVGGGSADVSITKTDGVTSVVAGSSTTYTITASNAGPNASPATLIADTFPAACTSVNWTCVGAGGGTCTASGTGNINQNVNLPVGASATFTAICNINVAATGTLVNTATATVGGGVTDPTPGNNTATDTNTLQTPPNINVSPASLSATIPVNQSTTAPLTIGNTGQGSLTWNIAEEPLPRPPVPVAPPAVLDPSSARDEYSPTNFKPSTGTAGPRSTWRAPQAVLFDNGPLITNAGAGAGGADVSALQTAVGGGIFGFGHQLLNNNRVADDFVVSGSGWLVNTVTFFAYQTGSTTTSTMNAVTLQIWNGPPGAPGSSVVFGDTVTNRLVSSTFTNIYRTLDTALTNNQRPVMANVVTVNTFLPAGTYWLDWNAGGTLASGPWAPAVTLPGQAGKPGGNGLQSLAGAAFAPALDGTVQQDFPFLIDGLSDCASLANVPWLSVAPANGVTAGGASTPVTATFDATGLAAGSYSANLCVTSDDPTPAPGNGTALVVVPVSFTVTPEADLSITLTDSPDPANAGTNLTYTATVTNGGPSPADNVSITLPLPAGTSFVSATPSAGGTCNAASPVVCSWVGPIASAGVVSASIVAAIAPATTGVLSATATAATTTPDPVSGNNTATATTSVNVSADLSITLTDAPDPVTAGTNLVYTATVTNAGPSDATGVTVTMPVPANTTFVSGSTTGGGSCAGSPIVCTFPTSFAPTTSQTATITVAVSASAPNGSSISATATAGSASTDPNGANNTATASTLVAANANLQLTLSASSLAVLTNEPVTFTAVSLNLGPSDAQNLSITMTLTPDFRYTSHTATGATCTTPQVGTSGSVTCTWAGATAPNASRTLSVVAYSNNQGATAVNASTVSDTSDPVNTNNIGNVSVQVGFPVEEIPTMNQYGLILLGLMLALLGFVAVRRNS